MSGHRPQGGGMPFGVGYFETVDADEFIDVVEGKVSPGQLAEAEEVKESIDGQAKRAIQAGANFADALNELAGLVRTAKLDTKLAKGLKDVVARVDNAMSVYDHEIAKK